jgi:hypothetical protein
VDFMPHIYQSRRIPMRHRVACGMAALLLAGSFATSRADPLPPVAEASNMVLVGHSNLNGAGKGGEGLAMHQYPDGRRVLFLPHESAPMCFSVIDVTKPEDPKVVTQIPVDVPYARCNSLGLSGTTLAVAHQVDEAGQPHAGMDVYDVADPAHPKQLSHFDTSGPHSRGVHYLWFTDGHWAYLSTGAKDFVPHNKLDDQFLMIVDMHDPAHPTEAGRWWLPGTRVGDKEPQPPRVAPFDSGIRMHTPTWTPEHPDRLYVGWIDGGLVILDISDRAHPKLVMHRSWQSLGNGFAHTLLTIPSRNLMIQTEEATGNNCKDWPKRDWVWDINDETAPVPLAPLPPPADKDALCKAGGRFGAHNIAQNQPGQPVRILTKTVVGSFFNGGVRAYSIENPNAPVEIGYLVDAAPPGNAMHTIQINDVYVDNNGLIYANDRFTGGLDIIRYTGTVPLQ